MRTQRSQAAPSCADTHYPCACVVFGTASRTKVQVIAHYVAARRASSLESAHSRCIHVQVVDAPEVLTVLHKLPAAKRVLHALYHCHYCEFFPGFLSVVEQLEGDAYLAPHVRYYMREARVTVYRQYLASYKSVTLAAMAAAFGVSASFMDAEARRSLAAAAHVHSHAVAAQ
jgi:PCI domain